MEIKIKVTYGDFELAVVEQKSGVRAAEFIVLSLGKRCNVNVSHFPI